MESLKNFSYIGKTENKKQMNKKWQNVQENISNFFPLANSIYFCVKHAEDVKNQKTLKKLISSAWIIFMSSDFRGLSS